ncbi:MAG TPA: helix-turn-helix domain-containing protein [Sumerlaeia bacterium]|nr:helix-turn-helix domain-containing protein [Sumerlaeia bacterium]
MPSIEKVLKEEIQRLARKEIKAATADLRKASASHRRLLADFRRRIAHLEQDGRRLVRGLAKRGKEAAEIVDEEVEKARITAKMVRSIRTRLGLSQADFAKLVGVHKLSVYQWEHKEGRLSFRGDTKTAVVSVRNMTKAEAWKRLEEMG